MRTVIVRALPGHKVGRTATTTATIITTRSRRVAEDTSSVYLGPLCGEPTSPRRCVRVYPDDTGLNTRDRDGKFRRRNRPCFRSCASLRLPPRRPSPQRQIYSLLFTCSSPVVEPSAHPRSLCGEPTSPCRCVRVYPDDTGLNTRDRDG